MTDGFPLEGALRPRKRLGVVLLAAGLLVAGCESAEGAL